MDQRTTTLAAGAIAVALVTGVAGLSLGRREPSLAPKLLNVKLIPANEFGPATIQLTLLPPENRPKPDPDEDPSPIVFKIVDRNGRIFDSAFNHSAKPFQMAVSRTYGRPVEGPKIAAFYNEQLRGSLDLPPFPPPALRELNANPDFRIRASREFHDIVGTPTSAHTVVFRPVALMPKDECWDVTVLETNIALARTRGYPPERISPDTSEWLFAPAYAEDIDAARIKVVRRRRKVVSEDIVIPGLRLTTKAGKAIFDLKRPIAIKNHVGYPLTVSPYNPPLPVWQGRDPLSPHLELSTNGMAQIQSLFPGSKDLPWGTGGKAKPELFVQLLGPMPNELGLNAIEPFAFAGQVRMKKSQVTLPKATFDLRVRLYKTTWETLGTFETAIPVEK